MNCEQMTDSRMDNLARMALDCEACNITRNEDGMATIITFTANAMAEKGTWVRESAVWKKVG
jgi:hypothetical protein